VLGGTGGVGALAVQVAHLRGAEVTASIRGDAAELMRELGGDHVIDTRTTDLAPQSYDVVIDTVGGQALEGAFSAVRRGGRLVTLSAPPPAGKADELGVQATFFIVTPDRGQLAELAGLVDAGRLRVAIADTFPLAQGRTAYESRGNTHRRPGKTVLIVRE
jgi:NADPH:quinone reductase-like Zn-dependent oxidoreductase